MSVLSKHVNNQYFVSTLIHNLPDSWYSNVNIRSNDVLVYFRRLKMLLHKLH